MSEEKKGMEVIILKLSNSNSLEETIGNKCININISESKRAIDVSLGRGLIGTNGYEDAGCYECNGYNLDCTFYTSNFEAFGDSVSEYLK